MARHAAPPIRYPNQRALRTAVQTIASVVACSAAIITGLAVFAPQFLEAVRALLPPDWYAFGLAAVAVIGALSAAITRVMAIPMVDAWLTGLGIGSVPFAVAERSAHQR